MNTPYDSIKRASALLGTPCDPDGYVILKLVPDGAGCCCLHHWPETWMAVDRQIAPAGPVGHLPLSDKSADRLESLVRKSLTERGASALAEGQEALRSNASPSQPKAGRVQITPEQLRRHVEATGARAGGRGFACEVQRSPRGEPPFDYSIRFHSPRWSPATKRWVGPDAIKRYLKVFNADNDAPSSAYRNVEGKGSRSASAQYLVRLLREISTITEGNRTEH